MKKIFVLCICIIALYVFKNQKDSYDYTYPELISQAVAKSDWTTAARLSQRVLLEEIDPEIRWNALQNTVLASKNLGDLTWAINALENSVLDYSTQGRQEYIYTELMLAQKEKLNFIKARDAATHLLSLSSLSNEVRTETEIKHAEFSLALNDFDSSETMLLNTLSKNASPSSLALANFMLATLYYYNNKLDKCEKYIDTFLELGNTDTSKIGQALFIKADIAEVNEDFNLAYELYNKALDLHPNPDTINIRLKHLENLVNTKEIF